MTGSIDHVRDAVGSYAVRVFKIVRFDIYVGGFGSEGADAISIAMMCAAWIRSDWDISRVTAQC